jgi:hypothetical protein
VSSEANRDYLYFKIDGTTQNSWSGTVAWSEVSFSYTAGIHTFRWEYNKDGGLLSGSDKAWIDNIRWLIENSAPSVRANQTAVWTGTEMIILGGYNGSYFNTGGRYNPVNEP